MEDVLNRATPAIQVFAVVLSYIINMFNRVGGLFSFFTGITRYED